MPFAPAHTMRSRIVLGQLDDLLYSTRLHIQFVDQFFSREYHPQGIAFDIRAMRAAVLNRKQPQYPKTIFGVDLRDRFDAHRRGPERLRTVRPYQSVTSAAPR